ncbi:restriction endonuclease subunit S [Mycoplasmopsis gallinarum]|uniref:restriction endonuclease subunit S n=1 Tax=Mycoplasmopsis gallinarum TaxID=29557 RepID=UPI0006885F81|nr:restriction endonuclease subunit S [Mycoplasmopsis gallinarum]
MLVKLGTILKVQHGFAFKSEYYVENSSYRLVTLGNFSENNTFKTNDAKATYYCTDFPSEFILQENDLIMPLTEQVVGLFGNTALVPYSKEFKFVLNQRVGKIICDEQKVDKIYLHYLLATKSVKKQLEDRASGTRQRNISPENIYDVIVDLPPIEMQRKIGGVLKSIEDQIERNNAMIKKLQVLGKAIYSKNIDTVRYSNLSIISTITTGKENANHATTNGKYKFFTCSDSVSLCDDFKFEGKSILVAGNGNFNVKYYDGKFNAYQRTYIIKNNEIIGDLYYTLLFNTELFKKKANGSIIKFLTIDMLNKISVPLFDNKTNYLLNKFLSEINIISENTDYLLALKSKLLPLLINQQLT